MTATQCNECKELRRELSEFKGFMTTWFSVLLKRFDTQDFSIQWLVDAMEKIQVGAPAPPQGPPAVKPSTLKGARINNNSHAAIFNRVVSENSHPAIFNRVLEKGSFEFAHSDSEMLPVEANYAINGTNGTNGTNGMNGMNGDDVEADEESWLEPGIVKVEPQAPEMLKNHYSAALMEIDERPNGNGNGNDQSLAGLDSTTGKNVCIDWKQWVFKANGIYNCKICNYTSRADSSVKYHVRAKHVRFRYRCTVCSKIFNFQALFRQHAEQVHENSLLQPEIEMEANQKDRESPQNSDIDWAEYINRKSNGQISCKLCSKAFIAVSTVKNHVLRDHFQRRFKCPLCTEQYRMRHVFREHAKARHGNENLEPIVESSVKEEINGINGINGPPNGCVADLSTPSELLQNFLQVVGAMASIQSSAAVAGMPLNHSLTPTSINNQSTEPQTIINCNIGIADELPVSISPSDQQPTSGQQTPLQLQEKKLDLQKYIKLNEDGYTCELCDQLFNTRTTLVRHVKRDHLQVRYRCPICAESFYRTDRFRTHARAMHPEVGDEIQPEREFGTDED